jgi:TIR domain
LRQVVTDIFISYAREDRDCAEMLAEVLTALEWSVWWDQKIMVGRPFDHAIEAALKEAKCVVVLWSRHSIKSEWVKSEAAVAVKRDVLVPAMIDEIELPLEFQRKQTANLIDWTGDHTHSGFDALYQGIRTTLGSKGPSGQVQNRKENFRGSPDNPRYWNKAMLLTWLGSVIFLFLFGEYGPSDLQQASPWLAYLLLLPGIVPMVLAYAIPLRPRSVFIRSLILYLGLFVVFGLSLLWLEKWEPTVIAPLVGIVLALCSGWLASRIARVVGPIE